MRPYDWHAAVWASLAGDPGKLPHALLLAGPAGMGKSAFAEALAARLLCEGASGGPDFLPCGECPACNWLRAGNHPDLRIVQPEDASAEDSGEEGSEPSKAESAVRKSALGQVKVDQIRELEDFIFVGSHRRGNRVVVISQAETMTPAAANSLLKILEEPPLSVYFILISSQWRRLLPTLLSRCRKLILGCPDRTLAQRWLLGQGVGDAERVLDLAGGLPLLAAEFGEKERLEAHSQLIESLLGLGSDPIAMAAKWATLLKAGPGLALWQLVEAIQKWLTDLGTLKMAGRCRYYRGWQDRLAPLAASASAPGIMACYNDLLRIRAVAKHPLNAQLFLEDLAARYLRAVSPVKA